MSTSNTTGATRLSPLSRDLTAEKRAFVEDLRLLFSSLRVSVRRYAARRHLDASTLTRYLKGERLAQWDFVATLIADLREAGSPITPEAEQRIRELHREALQSNRPASKRQKLEDQLAAADEEARRKRAHAQALEEALLDRMQRLSHTEARCNGLVLELEQQALAHQGEVDVWQGEYEQLGRECDDLQQEITYLKEALAVTRAELIAAEDQCHMLESQLETVQGLWQEAVGVPSLMAALEATDRSASVPELVTVVSDLVSRTQRAMASELVTSVSKSRRVHEVAALLAGLDRAGLGAHAKAALPVLALTRPIDDLGLLAAELHRSHLVDCGAQLLQAAVQFHTAPDTAAFALALDREQLSDHVAVVIGAFCATRPVPEVLDMVAVLVPTDLAAALPQALRAAAVERPTSDIVELSRGLGAGGWCDLTSELQAAAVAARPATDVTELIESLSRQGLLQDADFVFDSAQSRGTGHLVALVAALRTARNHVAAAAVLQRAALTRAPGDIAALITDLHATGNQKPACDVLIEAAARRPACDFLSLLSALDEGHREVRWVLEHAARISSASDGALLFRALNEIPLPSHAEMVLACTLKERPTGHAGHFLRILHQGGAAALDERALLERAREMPPTAVASLALALASVRLGAQLDAVLRGGGAEKGAGEITILLRQVARADSHTAPMSGRIFDRLAHACLDLLPVEDLAVLVLALEAASLNLHAAALTRSARTRHHGAFTSCLRKERTKNEQKVFSTRFWRSQGDVPLPAPGPLTDVTWVKATADGRRGRHRRN
ncbi:hypothetical protein GCM10010277_80300 [Streptomyces longisporoflavus]|uniref:hypothetical protein n=1 Tax=Streptomyces longisporoflavus TaxID=28044 RepID=UPI00167C7CD7|nr:hypothetical protein [Streptomyces longisporoflavus]GGV69853.1 hypothetical protein GCM10010277_80300 [Streptomyces longisporoflavus]